MNAIILLCPTALMHIENNHMPTLNTSHTEQGKFKILYVKRERIIFLFWISIKSKRGLFFLWKVMIAKLAPDRRQLFNMSSSRALAISWGVFVKEFISSGRSSKRHSPQEHFLDKNTLKRDEHSLREEICHFHAVGWNITVCQHNCNRSPFCPKVTKEVSLTSHARLQATFYHSFTKSI